MSQTVELSRFTIDNSALIQSIIDEGETEQAAIETVCASKPGLREMIETPPTSPEAVAQYFECGDYLLMRRIHQHILVYFAVNHDMIPNICMHCNNESIKEKIQGFKILHANKCEFAARKGYLDLLMLFYENGIPITSATCDAAIKAGNFDCFKYSFMVGKIHIAKVVKSAIQYDNIECLIFLHRSGIIFDNDFDNISSKHITGECFEYIIKNDDLLKMMSKSDTQFCAYAASFKSLTYLKKLHELGFACDINSLLNATKNNNEECINYIIEVIKLPITGNRIHNHMMAAIQNDNLLCLIFLCGQGGELTTELCESAAISGKFECFKYICEQGIEPPRNKMFTKKLINLGHYKCLKYSHEVLKFPLNKVKIFNIDNYGNMSIKDPQSVYDCIGYSLMHGDL